MPRISEERRAERRDQIVRAATRCAIRSGLDGMTMAQVIRESGLSAGAVYGYFAGKADLVAAIVDSQLDEIVGMLHGFAVADELPDIPELMQTLTEEIERLAQSPDGDLSVMVLLSWGDAAKSEASRRLISGRLQTVIEEWEVIVSRMQADGRLDPDADTADLARVVHSTLPGYILLRMAGTAPTPERFADAWRSLLGQAGR
ncbi:TetR/AcrR family transcriptional regulator [Flexivirga sp. ID2601S]|uniref:TetR/AcrR family transcriptional regulator n=1 Tax=Flexivirga aerilata TaxID=1656889 RepID=A0A849ACS5_9MICO|nr:TetR/AcrR family transcriptional regulator [Flexivirga aerilata]